MADRAVETTAESKNMGISKNSHNHGTQSAYGTNYGLNDTKRRNKTAP